MDVVFGKLRFNYHMRENKRQTVTKNRLSGNRQTKRIYKKKKTNWESLIILGEVVKSKRKGWLKSWKLN